MRRVTCSNADRGGHIGGDTVPYSIGGDKGKGTGYVVLGTDVGCGRGFQSPRAKARVGLEGRWRGIGLNGWSGVQTCWLDGWMDG